jgi:arylsulfatase A-like enzyme
MYKHTNDALDYVTRSGVKKPTIIYSLTVAAFISIISSSCTLLTSESAGGTRATKTLPNLVIILADDLGYADVGFNGSKEILTPEIDRIAKNGVRFTDAYVTYPVCGPSRAALLTGRYQDRFGFTTNPTLDPTNATAGLPVEEQMISEALRQANYKSAIVGKWHMGTHPVFHPLQRGFDYFFGFLGGFHQYFPDRLVLDELSEVQRMGQWGRTKIMENHERIVIDDYLTDELSDAAVRFMQKQVVDDQHFLLYLSYNAPHTPMQATDKYLSRFPNIEDPTRRTYAAMVSAMDDGIGRVMKYLQSSEIEENTIVVFLSDNGGARTNASQNIPLRGYKGDLLEGGIRVPFVMQWKGTIPSGIDYTEPVSSMDIMGTIVSLAGVKTKHELDGVNLIPYITGDEPGSPHEILFWRNWKNKDMAVRRGQNKIISSTPEENHEFFILTDDISEKKNVVAEHQKEAEQLYELWEKWNAPMKGRAFPDFLDDRWWEKNGK